VSLHTQDSSPGLLLYNFAYFDEMIACNPQPANDDSTQAPPGDADHQEISPMHRWAAKVDQQVFKYCQLKCMASEEAPPEDVSAVGRLLDEVAAEASSLETAYLDAFSSWESRARAECEATLEAFSNLVRKRDGMQIDSGEVSQTPQRVHLGAPSALTPTTESQRKAINFDDYPHTPTLEELGLSRATLSLVGDRQYGKSAFLCEGSFAPLLWFIALTFPRVWDKRDSGSSLFREVTRPSWAASMFTSIPGEETHRNIRYPLPSTSVLTGLIRKCRRAGKGFIGRDVC